MTDARTLFARYVAQRLAVEPGPVVLDTPAPDVPASHASPAPSPPSPPSPSVPDPSRRWQKDLPPIPPAGVVVETPVVTDLFKTDPLAGLDLTQLQAKVDGCTRCALHRSRTNAVFGEGPPDAALMVVGEGPGQTEDETGRPFVGRAGELLTEILAAIECPRDTVYIANVVKSRPPNNRKPSPEETQACVPYLYRQIQLIQPKVILAMGATAAETLLGVRGSLGSFRNRVHRFRDIPLIVTYHPAALLRNPHWKRPTWDDVRIARQLLES